MIGLLKAWLGVGPPVVGGAAPPAAPAAPPAARVIRARYDNAQTNDGNRRLWGLADQLSAKSANSPQVRRTLRMRARYEIANSSYLRGIINTSVNDLVGTGPTVKFTTADEALNRRCEAAFNQWWKAVGGVAKLRVLAKAKRSDGEGFLVTRTDPDLGDPVKLYPQDVECDQVATPMPAFDAAHWIDGVVLDPLGRAVGYNVLRSHPGDFYVANLNPLAYDRVPARYVVHWFRKDRPGQARGVPEVTPALELFGELRRYRRAVLGAAETAASIAAYLKTEAPANDLGDDDGGDAGNEPFKTLEIERDLLTMLPAGTDIRQLDAKQPTTTFDSFQEKLLGEACRCLDFPLNLALGTSQKFNFSSARMDWFKYHGSLEIERGDCECVVLDPLVRSWADEAVMVPGLLPDGLTPELLSWEWHWPGFPYMDPLTDAKADTERLTVNKTLTYARYYARRGLDWRDEFAQEAAEARERERLGLPPVVPTKETITETEDDRGAAQQKEAAAAA